MRVKCGVASRQRRKGILKQAKGYRGSRSTLYKTAVASVERALKYAYRDRKARKRQFRELWVIRIGAAARLNGTSYSRFMGAIKRKGMGLDRKVLADIAVHDPLAFKTIVQQAME